jgi:signal transduction histidine kinase/ActR/RegA family two-component response regulator
VGEQSLQALDEYLFKYLRDVMYAPSKASLDLRRIPDDLQTLGKGLQFFCECAMESASLAKSLSKGVLGVPLPSRQNEMAAPLKSLHATLSHLTWQTQQVAKGDYSQRVNFMGDFADAFNTMIQQLDERWKTLEDLYRRSSAHIRFIHKLGENLLSISGSGYTEAVVNSLKDLCETFGCAILSLWRAEGGGRFRRLFHWPAGNESLSFMVRKDWPREWLDELAAGKQVFVNDLTLWEGLFSQKVQSLMVIPLMVKGEFWGFMAMPGHTEKFYTDEEVSFMTAGGILIVSAILEKETTDSLVAAKDAALQATRVKSEFLSRMSHEMRTPMNAIIGMTHIAEGASDKEKLQFCLSTIETSAAHLLNLINDVLDMSKIEAGKLELDAAPFDVEKMLMKVCSLVEEKVEQKNQTLSVVMGKDMCMNYIGDEMRLSQVVTNLLGNAVKFTPENGKIRLSVDEAERGKTRDKLRFVVSDNGIGISHEQAERLFNSFQQADPSIAKRYGGTGLGLAISKKLVEQMNGRIEVFSEPGKGATFTFDVELERDPRQDAVPDVPDEPAERSLDLSDKRMLLVDDVDLNRMILAELLGDTNIGIDEAADGETALSMFENSPENHYDIVFMDIQMPGMNGYETTLCIRKLARPDAQTTPIIALTANAYKEDVEKALQAGMDGHLSKPVDIDKVRDLLETRLKK